MRETQFDDRLVDAREIVETLKIGLTKWWTGVAKGEFPQPIRLGKRCTRWKKSDIDTLIESGVHGSSR